MALDVAHWCRSKMKLAATVEVASDTTRMIVERLGLAVNGGGLEVAT